MGDPSGRTKERDQLQMETLEKNLQGISENLARIFNNYEQLFDGNSGPPIQYDSSVNIVVVLCVKSNVFDGCRIYNNADWWGEVKAVEFVSDIARHFRVSSMLAKERYGTYHVVLLKYMYILILFSVCLSFPSSLD